MKTSDLIEEAISLPIEKRAMLVESVLESLNPSEAVIDQKWAATAVERLLELKSGKVEPVQGKDVFNRLWNRL